MMLMLVIPTPRSDAGVADICKMMFDISNAAVNNTCVTRS